MATSETHDLDDIGDSALGKFLPEWCHPYLLLARLDRPIGWWLLLLPGWVAIVLGGMHSGAGLGRVAGLMLLFWVGAIAMRGAGCVVNDLWDRDIDGKVERTRNRPIAAGIVSPRSALVFLGLLCIAGLVVLLFLPPSAIATGLASLPLIALYPLAKRWIGLPQVFLGITYSWGALLGWAAYGSLPGIEAGVLYLACIFWVFGYDTVYSIQDMRDDRTVGIRSSALTLGKATRPVVALSYAVTLFLLLELGALLQTGPGWHAGVILAGLHLGWQVLLIDTKSPRMAGSIFRSNRDTGLIITAAALVEYLGLPGY